MRRIGWFLLFFSALLPVAARAQIGLYGTFTGTRLSGPDTDWLYGGTLGAYLSHGHLVFLSTGLDLRGSAGSYNGTIFDSGSIGPRIALSPHILPVKPYAEALAGLGHASFSGNSANNVTKFEYQFLGGLDFTVLPRLDWRVVEFSYGALAGLDNGSIHPKTLSSGLVLRIPWL
jgi:hypothetical protein